MPESQTALARKRKIESALPKPAKRLKGETYIHNNEVKLWTGKGWHCKHNRRQAECKDCGGSQICAHNRTKSSCKDCEGSHVCEHNRIKSSCKDCGGPAFCEHGRRKERCRDCGGSAFCEHNRRKSVCKDCRGSRICEHNKEKSRCYICSPGSKTFCINCKLSHAANKQLYKGNCFACYCQLNPDKKIPRRTMLKENYIHDYLRAQFPDLNLIHGKTTQCNEFKRKPDWIIDCFKYVIVIECDEDCHRRYSCENKRMMEILLDFNKRNIVFIRFNPDRYNGESCFAFDETNKLLVHDTWHIRKVDLKNTVQRHLDTAPEKECTIEYLFYSDESKN